MNSFTLIAVGNLARTPELSTKGNVIFARFCLVGNDKADSPQEEGTHLWFLAYGAIATAIARGARRGDQLILEARVIGTHWIDKPGGKQYCNVFIVTGFRFGARRGDQGAPTICNCDPPDKPLMDAALVTMEETT
jgi:single-stranded DNA-binding protein